ncbi:MAG: ECF-type sigma factor [Gammaproteobacteria bacterium]
MPASDDVTRLLADWRAGDSEALNQLTPMVYSTLRALARVNSRRRAPTSAHPPRPARKS